MNRDCAAWQTTLAWRWRSETAVGLPDLSAAESDR